MVTIHKQSGSHASQILHVWLKVFQELPHIACHVGGACSWPQAGWLQKMGKVCYVLGCRYIEHTLLKIVLLPPSEQNLDFKLVVACKVH